jgi:hypothetical protein
MIENSLIARIYPTKYESFSDMIPLFSVSQNFDPLWGSFRPGKKSFSPEKERINLVTSKNIFQIFLLTDDG